jgi:hypothetical protein
MALLREDEALLVRTIREIEAMSKVTA